MAQDENYYYEIQLTNKQLVFYFMAGATGLILSFLAGIMVGRGVDAAGGEVQAARVTPVREEKVVPEEAPVRTEASPAPALTYAKRLEGEKLDDALDSPKSKSKPAPAESPAAKPAAKPETAPAAAKPAPQPKAGATSPGAFSIQVGAFKDRSSAESVVTRLKGKGYAAYVVTPEGADGLFNVRVGSYAARGDAERIQTQLKDEEKFKPFIVHQ